MRSCLSGLQHIGLPTTDYTASCKFYDTLGFDKIYETNQPNGLKVCFYRQGNLEMEIYEADEIAGKDGAFDHVALDCTDIDKAFKKMSEAGYPIVSNGIESLDYWDNGIKFFHVKGPAGEKVEFCQKL